MLRTKSPNFSIDKRNRLTTIPVSSPTNIPFRIKYILGDFVRSIYEISREQPIYLVGMAICCILAAFFVGYLVKNEPDIKGSGIPQVEGQLPQKMLQGCSKWPCQLSKSAVPDLFHRCFEQNRLTFRSINETG